MELMHSWKNSLIWLKPNHVKKFITEAFNRLIGAYKAWFGYWWWLIVAFIAWKNIVGVSSFEPIVEFLVTGAYHFVRFGILPFNLITFIGIVLLYLTLYVSCHNQSRPKNYFHFFRYYKHFIYIALWFIILGYINLMILEAAASIFGRQVDSAFSLTIIYALGLIYSIFVAWVSSLFIVILVDSKGSIKDAMHSLLQALKIVVYHLPFCLVTGLCAMVIYVSITVIYVGILALIILITYASYFYLLAPEHQTIITLITNNIKMIVDLLLALPVIASVTTTFYRKKIKRLMV